MEYETPPVQSNNNSSSSKIIWIVVVALIALALVGVGGYFYGKMVKDKELQAANQAHAAELANVKVATEAVLLNPVKTVTDVTCNADELALTVEPGSATGAGTLSYNLVFANISKRTCNLYGYPGVSLVNENGNIIGEPAARAANATEAKIALAPNAKIESQITIGNQGNFTEGQCKTGAIKLRVYPPNDFGYLSVAAPVTAWCPGFEVWPVAAQ